MRKFLANFEEIVAATFLSVLLVLTICNVGLRFTTGRSLAWSEEISYMCFAWVVFVGASAVYKRGMHSSIDIIVHFLPGTVSRALAFCVTLTVTAAIAVIAWLSIELTYNAYTKLTPILYIPYTFIDLSITTGFALMFVHSIGFLRNIVKHDNYRDVPLYAGIISLDPNQVDHSQAQPE